MWTATGRNFATSIKRLQKSHTLHRRPLIKMDQREMGQKPARAAEKSAWKICLHEESAWRWHHP
jgi:hypothetical protein